MLIAFIRVVVKAKVTLEQTTKAQSGSRGVLYYFTGYFTLGKDPATHGGCKHGG
jgi:hypothetical protein